MNKFEKELFKKEVKTYYETHADSIKEVAKIYNIKERTLYDWIKEGNWEQGKLLKQIDTKKITKALLKDRIGSEVTLAKDLIKKDFKEAAGDFYHLYEQRVLDNAADSILLKAMSEDFINKQMIKTALIAQDKFNIMASNSGNNEVIIKSAKDLVGIFGDIKKSLYGNQENNFKLDINNYLNGVVTKEEIGKLSDDEIRQVLSQRHCE